MTDLSYKTIPELAKLIRSGSVSPVQLAEASLERLDTVGRSLNAVVRLLPELAMQQAQQAEDELSHGVDRGPLHGIPFGAKDLLATAGIPTSWGMAPRKDQIFAYDARVISLLREAGAVLVAKLAMVEGAGGFGYEQPNATFSGPGKSAWCIDAWAGGSSSGSGSAVGSGCVPFAIGTETWGSIHVPAAFNGITGFRPTYDLVRRDGAMALSWSMDKIGPLARTVEDCGIVLQAIADSPIDFGLHMKQDGFRFAVLKDATKSVQDEVGANFSASLAVLEKIGTLEEVALPDLPFDEAASLVIMAEAASAFEEFIVSDSLLELTAPEDRSGMLHGLAVPAVDYLRALRIRKKGQILLETLLADYDAILAPTTPTVAPAVTAHFESWSLKDRGPSLGGPGNLCGLPSISVPNGFGEGKLPTSIEFMGKAGSESRLAQAASRYQQLTTWHTIFPEL